MQRWESEPLALPTHDVPFVEASLDFEDIQHDGPSFTVYVYFDNPGVDAAAGADGEGYVGTFRVFGHGDCWGSQGHCDPSHDPLHDFDLRHSHPLAPIDLSLDCTEALREIAEKDEVKVTALAYADDPDADNLLRFAGLSLVTYD